MLLLYTHQSKMYSNKICWLRGCVAWPLVCEKVNQTSTEDCGRHFSCSNSCHLIIFRFTDIFVGPSDHEVQPHRQHHSRHPVLWADLQLVLVLHINYKIICDTNQCRFQTFPLLSISLNQVLLKEVDEMLALSSKQEC